MRAFAAVPEIAVLGPGGVGGFVAAALARAGNDVTVVARAETAAAISEGGIEVQSVRLGDFTAHPRAIERLAGPAETLVIATKATGLDQALSRIDSEPTLVVPLLNGLDHIAKLRAHFAPQTVAAATIRIESNRPEPGRIVQTSPFLRVDLASDDGALVPRLRGLEAILTGAEIPTTIGPSEAQTMWSKLVRLNALALTTSAADRTIGFIRADPRWRGQLSACIEETAAVARADGADVDAGNTLAELEEAHAELGSSMQRDIAAGRQPELDAIAGAVLRAAARHGLDCPTIGALAEQVARRAGIPPPRT
jgi:2-dehydropantoate 2-reductase